MTSTSTREEHLPTRRDSRTACARRSSERLQIVIVAVAVFASLCGSPGLIGDAHAGITLAQFTFASPTASPTPTPNVNPVIYATNPTLNSLSVFPPGSNGNVPTLTGQTQLSNPYGIAYFAGNLYVTNPATNSITVYPSSASGSPNPIITISGSSTQLDDPVAIALDSAGNIYVANQGSPEGNPDSITVYSAGSNGDVAPTAVITGSNTGLNFPSALTLDLYGAIYVANEGSSAGALDSITVYSPGSNGNATPALVISGSSTGLASPGGIAVDSSQNIYATSLGVEGNGSVSVLIFAPYSTGNVAPTASIDGDCAVITSPGAIALDSNANIYVTNPGNTASGDESVAVFSQSSLVPGQGSQCLTPMSNILGPNTGIAQPFGIAVDSAGDMYVTNSDVNSVAVFQSGMTGNVTPSATIASPNALSNPTGVAVDSNGLIYVANAGSQVGASDSITIYPSGSDASVAPISTIIGSDLGDPVAIATFGAPSSGNGIILWANQAAGPNYDGSVTIYTYGGCGIQFCLTIGKVRGGSNSDLTGLSDPVALAVKSGGDYFWVLNSSGGSGGNGSITKYATNASGNVAPWATIAGGVTGLNSPAGLALDHSNNIYVTNDGSISGAVDSITIYANAGSNGNVAPMATISGSNTGLNLPNGIAIDAGGYIYVVNDGSANVGVDTITVYSPGSKGNTAPIATISGSLTGLGQPGGIAVGPAGS
jgi:hypothetical protein